LADAVSGPLQELAAKSATFAAEVNAYRRATGELLRWRARVAAAEAKAMRSEYPASDEVVQAAAMTPQDGPGLITDQSPALGEARLRSPAPAAMALLLEKLLARKLTVSKIAALDSAPLCVAVYRNRHYATLPRASTEEAIRRLKADLHVADQLPPLSLAAAAAIASAERGDFAATGGTVEDVFLEGLVPRFATLVPATASLVPLGRLPDESPPDGRRIDHVLLRLVLRPAWVQHRYFFQAL
jgi:hypothetical protein